MNVGDPGHYVVTHKLCQVELGCDNIVVAEWLAVTLQYLGLSTQSSSIGNRYFLTIRISNHCHISSHHILSYQLKLLRKTQKIMLWNMKWREKYFSEEFFLNLLLLTKNKTPSHNHNKPKYSTKSNLGSSNYACGLYSSSLHTLLSHDYSFIMTNMGLTLNFSNNNHIFSKC